MKLIVGLGNPGGQYKNTRHNVGFLMIDKLQNADGKYLDDLFVYDNKFGGEVVQTMFGDQKVIFVKPMEFMNRSGGAVSQISNFYKIDSKDILVMHDDIDLGVGTIKLKSGGGSAGHNGLKDIIEKLGNGDFARIRIGVDRPENSDYVAEYVLSPFKKEEIENIESKFDDIEKIIEDFLKK
ncbi:aminoacyl-tRNA hydrolase [Candidatus Gracilibacteria bacterium]|nr:aminoacyl-tRNA hydrolase [Candidatus Gracilibacteria bacterium]